MNVWVLKGEYKEKKGISSKHNGDRIHKVKYQDYTIRVEETAKYAWRISSTSDWREKWAE